MPPFIYNPKGADPAGMGLWKEKDLPAQFPPMKVPGNRKQNHPTFLALPKNNPKASGTPCAAHPASSHSPADVCRNEMLRGSQIPLKTPTWGMRPVDVATQGYCSGEPQVEGQPSPRGTRHSQEQIKGIGAGCLPMENPSPIFSPGAVCSLLPH